MPMNWDFVWWLEADTKKNRWHFGSHKRPHAESGSSKGSVLEIVKIGVHLAFSGHLRRRVQT